jgi:hypothetical protein
MITKILLVLVVLLVVFLVVAALQPDNFRIERSTLVATPPAAPFAQVNDFHRWTAWNPWGKIDPAMKETYEGAPAGVGAVYSWSGNKEVGAGRMTLVDSRPPELIRIKLEFLQPFAATNTAEFTFQPEGNQTRVTWAMFGKKNFISKAMCLFMSMDKMVGGQFEKGLADLKSVSEAAK